MFLNEHMRYFLETLSTDELRGEHLNVGTLTDLVSDLDPIQGVQG